MRIRQALRARRWSGYARGTCLALLTALGAIALVSCGSLSTNQRAMSASTPTSASQATATSTAAPTTPIHTNSAAFVCPTQQAPADASAFAPGLILTASAGPAQSVSVGAGQHIEIRLAASSTWTFTRDDTAQVLSILASEGWIDTGAKMCVWRFAAAKSGTARLTFVGAVVCPPLKVCPAADQTVVYTISVK